MSIGEVITKIICHIAFRTQTHISRTRYAIRRQSWWQWETEKSMPSSKFKLFIKLSTSSSHSPAHPRTNFIIYSFSFDVAVIDCAVHLLCVVLAGWLSFPIWIFRCLFLTHSHPSFLHVPSPFSLRSASDVCIFFTDIDRFTNSSFRYCIVHTYIQDVYGWSGALLLLLLLLSSYSLAFPLNCLRCAQLIDDNNLKCIV